MMQGLTKIVQDFKGAVDPDALAAPEGAVAVAVAPDVPDDGYADAAADEVVAAGRREARKVQAMANEIKVASPSLKMPLLAAYVRRFYDALIAKGYPEQQAKVRKAELQAVLLAYAHGVDAEPIEDARGLQAAAKVARKILKDEGLMKGRQRAAKQADPMADLLAHVNAARKIAQELSLTEIHAALGNIANLLANQ